MKSLPPACLCAADSDTLAEEAYGLPKVPHILTGWSPRNPPLYYEMRLAGVTNEIKQDPNNLDLYDDAAVAADRLGNSSEAIRFIDKKYQKLKQQDPSIINLKDHWYRYYANKGTFLAHQWIKEEKNKGDKTKLTQSIELIKKALEINPDAHFGREKYQLHLIELIAHSTATAQESPTWITKDIVINNAEDAIQGLAGLIALGAAWESIDVFDAIYHLASAAGHNSIADIAKKRVQALAAEGKERLIHININFIITDQTVDEPYWSPDPQDIIELEQWYKTSITDSANWQQKRTEFMLSKLRSGMHPDTHPNFWDGYQEVQPRPLPGDNIFSNIFLMLFGTDFRSFGKDNTYFIQSIVSLLVLIIIVRGTFKYLKRKYKPQSKH